MIWKTFAALTADELHAILKLRQDVFIIEQACLFRDIDGRDRDAHHLLAGWRAPETLGGCLRLMPPAGERNAAGIGRVVVHADQRRTGLGQRMMVDSIAYAERTFGPVPVALSAQTYLERFYNGLGFARCSDDYLDEGDIPHLDMVKPAADNAG